MKMKIINFKKLYLSFKYAFEGLKVVFFEEQSFRIQLVIAAIVLAAMFFLHLHYFAKAIVVLAIVVVLGLEILNTQIERTLNFLYPKQHAQVKKIKDLAAAAVLVSTVGAALVGFIIFLSPHL
jgi:undecaprenol kinase/diacylglycerol kinase (ATP)